VTPGEWPPLIIFRLAMPANRAVVAGTTSRTSRARNEKVEDHLAWVSWACVAPCLACREALNGLVIDILDVRRPARLVHGSLPSAAFLLIATGCQRATPSPPPTPIASAASAHPSRHLDSSSSTAARTWGRPLLRSREYPSSRNIRVHCSFEPNPELVPLIPKRPELPLHEEAIWTKDEESRLSFRRRRAPSAAPSSPRSSSAAHENGEGARDRLQPVAGAHLPKRRTSCISSSTSRGRSIPPSTKARDGTMALIDRLYIEFHGEQAGRRPEKAKAVGDRRRQEG